jgi:mycobactin peptide synthetase MbtF
VVTPTDLLSRVDLTGASDDELNSAIAESARRAIDDIDPRTGTMVRAVWFSGAESGHVLLLTAHHLTVDSVSWHILLGDVTEAARSMHAGEVPKMLPEFTSYRRWSELMWQRAGSPEVAAQRDFWTAELRAPDPVLGARAPDPTRDTWSNLQVTRLVTPVEITESVLSGITREEGIREFLLAATTMTIASWRRARGQDPAAGALVALEGHGRADHVLDADTTNTVGSFIISYPVRLGAGAAAIDVDRAAQDGAAAKSLLQSVVTHLDEIPNDGLDYGLLRYVERVPDLQQAGEPQILFSYLGRLDLSGASEQPWSVLTVPYIDALPANPEPDLPLRFALHISALVGTTPEGTRLVTNLRWSDALFTASDIDLLTHLWQRSLTVLAAAV